MSNLSEPTRRDVLKTAGAVTATVAAATLASPGIQKVKAANDQVPYALIGTGSRGQYLLRHLSKIDRGRCVALCDIVDSQLKKGIAAIGGNPKGYKDYRDLLNRQDIPAVIITTPLYEHFRITRDALLAGKHVFCEKSLVFKPEEIHQLRKLSNERPKQILQTGLQRRYSQFYQTAKAAIDKGLIGKVLNVNAQWNRNPGWVMKPDMALNWRLFRKYSGGLVAELGSHQVDVADWVFGSTPEFVSGVGGLDYYRDGRDVFDNVQLIYKYPKGQKMMYQAVCTNRHLSIFGGTRTEFGETIMGTEGTIEITVGLDTEPAIALWYYEPSPPKPTKAAGGKEKAAVASASLTTIAGGKKGLPLMLSRDTVTGKESFLSREMKFARRWLYSKGVMVPEEDRNPVDIQMEAFLNATRTWKRPLADLETGLADSTMVILSNLAMDEGRRVYFNEINKMGV